jgi:hypothetical protein
MENSRVMEESQLKSFDFRTLLCRLVLAVFVVAVIGLSGCATAPKGDMRLVSMDSQHEFVQRFTQAYYARSSSGDTDIVLVQDSLQPNHSDPNKPLVPDRCVMPRQLVHIRVFWTPMNGVKADHPANTNASIHWCMVCDNSYQPGMIEYTGSGLVEFNAGTNTADVTVRKAWMKVADQHGQMVDPLGPSILNGSIRATSDPGQVNPIIAEIKAAVNVGTEARAN